MFSHISSHLALETHVLSYILPPSLRDPWSLVYPPPSLRDPCSLIYPPTQLERPMVSSLPCPPKSGSLACKIVLTSSLITFYILDAVIVTVLQIILTPHGIRYLLVRLPLLVIFAVCTGHSCESQRESLLASEI